MSRTCPSCGAPVSPTAKFCRSCGTAVLADPPLEPVPPEPVPPEPTQDCPACGITLVDSAAFCHGCGAAAPPPPPPPEPEIPERTLCPTCDQEIDGVDQFCRYCGSPTRPDSRPIRVAEPAAESAAFESAAMTAIAATFAPTPHDAVAGAQASSTGPVPELTPIPLLTSPSAHEPDTPPERELTLAEDHEPDSEQVTVLAGTKPPHVPPSSRADELSDAKTADAIDPDSATEILTSVAALIGSTEATETPTRPATDVPAHGTGDEETIVSSSIGETATPRRAVKLTCLVCHAPVSETARFCRSCGASFDDAAATVETPTRPSADVPAPATGEEETIASGSLSETPTPPRDVKLTCLVCGAPVSETARFCRSCGASFDDTAATVIMTRPAPSRCPTCTEDVEEWAEFCRHCGARLKAAGAESAAGTAHTCEVCGAPTEGERSLCGHCAQVVGA